jgi:branched-chain amino acid transport system permease protein
MSLLLTIAATWGIYTLLGIGIVLIYRTSRVLNIAGGELAIFLGYAVAWAVAQGFPVAAAVPIGLAAAAGLGLAVFWLMLRRIMGQPPHVGLMMTVGLAILLNGLIVILFGGGNVTIDAGFSGTVALGGAILSERDLAAGLGAWISVAALTLVYRLTNLGLQMRAVAEKVTLSAQRGVNINRIVALSWVLGVAAAALAGTLHGERAFVAASAAVIGINALLACLIGGMDSLRGVVVGGLIVSVSENLTAYHVDPRYALLAPVGLVLLTLVVRPWGLFGTVEEFRRV